MKGRFKMTLYDITVLIHIYAMTGPFSDSGITKTPLLKETIEHFRLENLIEESNIWKCGWRTTTRGMALMKRLRDVEYDDIHVCSKCGNPL